MSKHRKYPRQSATNPAQIRASHPAMNRIPVAIDSGDGAPKIVMVTQEEYEELQRRQATRVEAGAENE